MSQCAILLIEDDPTCFTLLQRILIKEGYRVIHRESSFDALDAYVKHQPDLVLLDCIFPDGPSGFEVCRQIVSHIQYQGEPIVFATGLTDPKHVIQGLQTGAVDFIRKPLIKGEIIARVRRHLLLYRRQTRERARAERCGLKLERMQSGLSVKNMRLDQIRRGQQRLLTRPESVPEIDTAVVYESAAEAGGDFYELRQLSEQTFGFLMADISGHDLGLAHVTGALKALALSYMNECMSVTDTMIMMNNALSEILPEMDYVTACYMKFNAAAGQLEVINAAHPNALVQPMHDRPYYLELSGDVLGMFELAQFDMQVLKTRPGDRVFIFTDGIIEGVPDAEGNIGSRAVGRDWLLQEVEKHCSKPLQEQCEEVIAAFHQCHPGTPDDDIVLLGIQL